MVRRNNTSPEISTSVVELIRTVFGESEEHGGLPATLWAKCCGHVKKVEQELKNEECAEIAPLVIDLGENNDSDEGSDEL